MKDQRDTKNDLVSQIRSLSPQKLILFFLGTFISFSVLTFGGFYFALPYDLRIFLDGQSWWKFFIALSVTSALSLLFTKTISPVAVFFLVGLRSSFFRARNKKIWRHAFRKMRHTIRLLGRYEVEALIFTFLTILSFLFLGVTIGAIFLCVTYMMFAFFYIFLTAISNLKARSNSRNIEFSKRLLVLSLGFALGCVNLGTYRLLYQSKQFSLISTHDSSYCAAIISATASGVIFANEIALFNPFAPYILMRSSFIPYDKLDSIEFNRGAPCTKRDRRNEHRE